MDFLSHFPTGGFRDRFVARENALVPTGIVQPMAMTYGVDDPP